METNKKINPWNKMKDFSGGNWWYIVLLDFPGGSDGKASVYNVRNLGSIPGLGRFPGEGNGNPR